MAWNSPCIDCERVRGCIEEVNHFNTVETCLLVAETGEYINAYKIITRNNSGNYTGVDHYEWSDFTPTTGFTVTEPGNPCIECCTARCGRPFVVERTCNLYTSLGSTYTFGAGGFLQDPSIFDDPCPPANPFGPCPGFDFECTNLYPIQVRVFDAAVSTDGGTNWTHFSPATITYNNPGDVTFSDSGYGLGWDGLAGMINPFLIAYDVQLQPSGGNAGVWEYSNGANESTHIVNVHWRWVLTGGNCEGVDGIDPYELSWAQESQVTSTLGQVYMTDDGTNATPTFNVETSAVGDMTAPIDSCQDV